MESQFTFEFNELLNKYQAKPIRILLEIVISFGLLLVGEYTFYNTFDKMTVVGCSLANQSSPITLDNCYAEGFELTTCIGQAFSTGSNYSLSFTVSELGIPQDKYSSPLIALAVITFLAIQLTYQIVHYFQFQKKKRLQDIYSEGMIFINCNKKHEKRLTIYFLVSGLLYIIIKIIWIVYRNDQYNGITCQGSEYKLLFLNTLSSSIGTLITSSIAYLILPLIYIGGWVNYFNDVDIKKITNHLSNDSIKQIKNVQVIDIVKYNQLIDSTIDKRYSNDSFVKLFMRKNTFSFWTTKTSEIVEILKEHKKSVPQDFEPILFKNSKISFIGEEDDSNNDKKSLIN